MRVHRLVLPIAALLLSACADDSETARAPTESVRIFAVGHKLELRYADSYNSFRDKMFAIVDRNHPRRAELVQADVDDVASHLDATTPALVVFPEDVALVAGLIGSRGAAARRVRPHTGGVQTAFASLLLNYQPQIDYYQARFPGLPPVRYLLLAATDTFYRSAYETFRDIAREHHVYVAATWNAAPARLIESNDDPELVALLRDPDEAATRSYAYVATSGDVFNATYVFDPEGNLFVPRPDGSAAISPAETDGILGGAFSKAYLTEAEQDTLPLAYGRVRDLDVLDTPIGRIASVISKDAWMIDVNDRFDAKRAEIILQPEAFSEWAFVADPWQPDGFKSGGVAQIQRNPSFGLNVTASMTGNLYEVTFDGQSGLVRKRSADVSNSAAWIGQNADTALLATSPWIVPDPIEANPSLTLIQRRQELAEAGQHLLPEARRLCPSATSYGSCENGYRESVIWSDWTTPSPESQPASDHSVSKARAAQRRPRIVSRGDHVVVVWEDDRFGFPNAFLAFSDDGGREFKTVRISDNLPGAVVELRPNLALDRDRREITVVWQEFCAGWDDDCGRIQLARFDLGGTKLGGDVRIDRGADSAGKWNPAVTIQDGDALITWIDERDPGPNGPFEHVYFSAYDRARGVSANLRIDQGDPVVAATALDNKWAPAIAASADLVVTAWTDFRNYNWDIFSASSGDGEVFSANVRLDDAVGFERIHDAPALAIGADSVVHAVWVDHRDTEADPDIFYARSFDGGASFLGHRQIDGSGVSFDPNRDVPSHQWHPRIAVRADRVVAVWQDDRLGDNDIWMAESADHGESFSVMALDMEDDGGEQTRPDIALDVDDSSRSVIDVVWEDGQVPSRILHRRLTK